MVTGIRALGISLLRTFVSWLWGLIIGWLILVLPIFEPFREQLLALSELALPTLVALIAAAWYALWRWLEPKLPNWAVAVLLGSSKPPAYGTATAAVAAAAEDDDEPKHRA